jgi:hypothetical protein
MPTSAPAPFTTGSLRNPFWLKTRAAAKMVVSSRPPARIALCQRSGKRGAQDRGATIRGDEGAADAHPPCQVGQGVPS